MHSCTETRCTCMHLDLHEQMPTLNIEAMANTPVNIDFTIPLPRSAGSALLRRCNDETYCRLLQHSIPILFTQALMLWLHGKLCDLPQTYVALTTHCGPSGRCFDHWKGSFAFSFEVDVLRGEQKYPYLLHIMNFRSSTDYAFYRIDGNTARRAYHEPFEHELTDEDMTHIVVFLQRFIKEYLETMPKWTTPFCLEVESNLILYGYDAVNDCLFADSYSDFESYEEARKSMQPSS